MKRITQNVFPDLFDLMFLSACLRSKAMLVALQQELDTILAAEQDKILQLICFNNPVPGGWQPMPKTCEGVEEQLVL